MKLLTTAELAARLGVSTRTIQRWVEKGRIVPAQTLPRGDNLFDPNTDPHKK